MNPADSAPSPTAPNAARAGWGRLTTALRWAFAVLFGAVLFLAHLHFPGDIAADGLDPSWQQALQHAFTHRRQAGVDYVFTYGPLGFLLMPVFDPETFALRVAWEIVWATSYVLVALYALGSMRWAARLVFVPLVALGPMLVRERFSYDADCLFLIAGAVLPTLSREKPRVAWYAAAVPLVLVLALTKLSFLTAGLPLLGCLVLHAALTHGRRVALLLAAEVVGGFLLLWLAAGQSPGNVPAFLRNSLEMGSSYGEAMQTAQGVPEALAALAASAAVAVAAWLGHSRAGRRWQALLLAAAAGAVALAFFKASFVRYHVGRPESFFWLLATVACMVAPAPDAPRWGRRFAWLFSFAAAATGVGFVFWDLPPWEKLATDWPNSLVRHASELPRLRARYAELSAERDAVAERHRLPRTAEAVGDEPVDLLTNAQGVVLLNGFRWQPRPVFQSYATHSPALQRLNRDFYRSPAAPPFVLLHHETIDDRLPTLDDGPALLELLHRYRPHLREKDYLLLRKREDAPADLLGPPLLDATVGFGEAIDLTSLGDGPKALRLEIDRTALGKLHLMAYRDAILDVVVTYRGGGATQFRLVPGMIREPVLIDPLPRDQGDLLALIEGRLDRRVATILVQARDPADAGYFEPTIRCQVFSLPHLPTASLPPQQ